MSDLTDRPTGTAQDGDSASNSDEAGSSQKLDGQGRRSLWSRAARIWRPNGTSLRNDLAAALLTDAGSDTAFSPEERAMLNNILRFREVRVEDVMVPRADIEAVDQDISIGELMVLFEESGRSRMPVYCDTLDDPRGMVHIRDLLAYVTKQARNKRRAGAQAKGASAIADKSAKPPKPDFDLGRVDLQKSVADANIVRQVLFVPPSMLASDLMERMQASRTQMALVIDEYGGTDGLASLEDIVEMVVGDIEDEHDDDELKVQKTSEDVFIADARVELEELAEVIGSDFDIRDQIDDVDTLGGLVFASLGRIPVRGEVVQALTGFEFHILEADPRRIKRIRITRKRVASRRRLLKGETETFSQGSKTPAPASPVDQEQSLPANSPAGE